MTPVLVVSVSLSVLWEDGLPVCLTTAQHPPLTLPSPKASDSGPFIPSLTFLPLPSVRRTGSGCGGHGLLLRLDAVRKSAT